MISGSKRHRRAALCLGLLLSACAGGQARGEPSLGEPSPTATPYSAFMAGSYAATAGHEDEAAHFFASAIAGDPDNAKLLRQGFVTALLAHSPDAVPLARRMGNDPLALLVLGNAAIEAGNDAKAATHFAALPKNDVLGLIRPMLIAWAEAGQSAFGPAIERLKAADAGPPFGPVNALNAALIADLAGREAEAAPLYRLAEQAFPAPNLRLAQAIASWRARQGNMLTANAILVHMVAAHPDLAIALPALERDAAKPIVSNAREGVAETYLTLAGSLSQPQQALLRQILLGFALELRPDLAAAHMLQANLDLSLHHQSRALAALAAVPASDPLHGPAVMQRAQLLGESGKGANVLPDLLALAKAHPHDADPLTLAGDIQRDGKNYAAARTLYARALARLGPNPPGSAWAIYYGRAITEDKTNDWPAAEADLNRALALDPGQPFILNYLGYSYALRGLHLARAQNMIEQALQADPNEGAIIDSLGYVLLRRGKIAHAMRVQIRAVERAPDDAEVNAHLADIYYAAGDRLAARNQWARALALHPSASRAAKIRADLKRDAGTARS